MKQYLIEKSPLKGSIQVICLIGCGDQDALKCFHFFKDDVLYGILSLRFIKKTIQASLIPFLPFQRLIWIACHP